MLSDGSWLGSGEYQVRRLNCKKSGRNNFDACPGVGASCITMLADKEHYIQVLETECSRLWELSCMLEERLLSCNAELERLKSRIETLLE